MNSYLTGGIIKVLREQKGLTQNALAEKLGVSDKAVSKWETGKGYPDITLLEPLAACLHVSLTELLSGEPITNRNRSFQMNRSLFYICPICGNIIIGSGDAVVSCHGIQLFPAEAESPDEQHSFRVEKIEDEYYVNLSHSMTKSHYISFFAALSDNGIQFIKLYPEGNAEAWFKIAGVSTLFCYCNRHGLFKIKL
ncbi:MAG: helix-turn-helix domain-containing protein [Clostridia bacterium]|nr:helix-turn-helix domain-containing protein [Clostridia bacterium]